MNEGLIAARLANLPIHIYDGKQQSPDAHRIGATTSRRGGTLAVAAPMQEYERIYDRFAELLDTGSDEIDAAPLQLVADAFLVGKRVETAAFVW